MGDCRRAVEGTREQSVEIVKWRKASITIRGTPEILSLSHKLGRKLTLESQLKWLKLVLHKGRQDPRMNGEPLSITQALVVPDGICCHAALRGYGVIFYVHRRIPAGRGSLEETTSCIHINSTGSPVTYEPFVLRNVTLHELRQERETLPT